MNLEQFKKEIEKFKWNTSTINVLQNQRVQVVRGCNGFIATNVGDRIAIVNGQILFPSATPATSLGDSMSVGGNLGEIYAAQQIDIGFTGAGTAPNVIVTQKFYIAFDTM